MNLDINDLMALDDDEDNHFNDIFGFTDDIITYLETDLFNQLTDDIVKAYMKNDFRNDIAHRIHTFYENVYTRGNFHTIISDMLTVPFFFRDMFTDAHLPRWIILLPDYTYFDTDGDMFTKRFNVVKIMIKFLVDNYITAEFYYDAPVRVRNAWEHRGGIQAFMRLRKRLLDIIRYPTIQSQIKNAVLKHQIKGQMKKLEKKKYSRLLKGDLAYVPPLPSKGFPGGPGYHDTLANWNRMQKEEDEENEKRRQSSSRRSRGSSHISQIGISQIEKQLKQFEKLLKK